VLPVQETDAMIAHGSSQLKILEGSSDELDQVCPCCSLCSGFCDQVMLTGSIKYQNTAELVVPVVQLL